MIITEKELPKKSKYSSILEKHSHKLLHLQIKEEKTATIAVDTRKKILEKN